MCCCALLLFAFLCYKQGADGFVQKVQVAAGPVGCKKRIDLISGKGVVRLRHVAEVAHVEAPLGLRVPAGLQHCRWSAGS